MSELPPGITEHYLDELDIKEGAQRRIKFYCGFNCTDTGNANRLIMLFGDTIRYCAEARTWFIWDGIRWAPDKTKLIEDLAKQTAILIHAEASKVDAMDKDGRRKLTKWALDSEAQKRILGMIQNAQSDRRIAVEWSAFNKNKMLLNFVNGTLDLENREFRAHKKDEMLTMIGGAPFPMPDHESKYFNQTIMRALPPLEIPYIQRVLGLGLDPTTQNKEWLFIYGAPFALKSSVTQPCYKSLGDYAAEFDISLLTKSRHGIASNAARPEIMVLRDKRIIWTEEAPADFIIDDSRLKFLTSSGTKTTRDLFGSSEEIALICTVVVESNGTFTLNIEDDWTRDAALERTQVAKFVHPIPREERDVNILKALTHDPSELSQALGFLVLGYFKRLDDGLETPESIKETSEEFQSAINPLYSFFENELIFDDGIKEGKAWATVETSNSVLFERFKETSNPDLLRQVTNAKSFSAHFAKLSPHFAKKQDVKEPERVRIGSMGSRGWSNVRLVETTDEDKKKEAADASDANTSFGITLSRGVGVGSTIYQTLDLRQLAHYVTYLIEDDKQGEGIISDKETQNEVRRKLTQTDANVDQEDDLVNDLDSFIDNIEKIGDD